jgi:tRNA(Ile)-lysidine synthase
MVLQIFIMSLESFMQQALSQQPLNGRLLIAFSGGLDSSVLMHLIVKANQQLAVPKTIIALHINHQISTFANDWEHHCKTVCEALKIDFIAERVDISTSGKGFEAAAREARYKVFEEFVKEGDILLMAHHANDQAETFLLRLMRGAGVLGLSAMRAERALGSGQLWRPLLDFSRVDLETYAKANNLQWVEDDSNASIDFDRNFLRHQLMPIFLARWPQAIKQLQATSARLEQAQKLLDDLAAIDFQGLDERPERYGQSVAYKKCSALSADRLTNVLRYWCDKNGFSVPSADQLSQIHAQFFSTSARLSSAVVTWGDCECRQFNDRFYLMPLLKAFIPAGDHVLDRSQKNINLGVAGDLMINWSILKPKKLSIRWRQGGERCSPIDRAHSQTLKKLLQEYQLETWLRDRVPLIFCDDQLLAVGDLWLCKEIYHIINIENNQSESAIKKAQENSISKESDANKTDSKINVKDLIVWSFK